MAKKMVKPPPQIDDGPVDITQILKAIGEDRSYTVIKTNGKSWVLHFEGDDQPCVITKVQGKFKVLPR